MSIAAILRLPAKSLALLQEVESVLKRENHTTADYIVAGWHLIEIGFTEMDAVERRRIIEGLLAGEIAAKPHPAPHARTQIMMPVMNVMAGTQAAGDLG